MHTQPTSPPHKFLRLPAVEALTGYRRSKIYKMEFEGTFVKRIKLGPRTTIWIAEEVAQWMAERVAEARIAPEVIQ